MKETITLQARLFAREPRWKQAIPSRLQENPRRREVERRGFPIDPLNYVNVTGILEVVSSSVMDNNDKAPDMPPHVKVMNLIFGQTVGQCVSALAKLGIPDHLESGPKSAQELADEIGAQSEPLYRLMRATASVGILSEGPDGKFSQTPMSNALRTSAAPTLRHYAMFYSDEWYIRSWSALPEAIRTGKRPIEKIYGMPVFEYFQRNPEVAAVFDHGMTDLSTIDAPAVVDAYDFSGIRSITDVGGGYGQLLATILQRYPTMEGTLYDLPRVVESAFGGPIEPVKHRVSLAGGNMFESIPPGTDAYILKHVIHDWPDAPCIKMLKECRVGVNQGGKLLVVDAVIPKDNSFNVGKFVDLDMFLFPGGKERTEDEFRALFAASGWKLNRIIPTASPASIIEGVPA